MQTFYIFTNSSTFQNLTYDFGIKVGLYKQVCRVSYSSSHLSDCLPGSSRVRGLEHAQNGPLDVEGPHLLSLLWAELCDLSPLEPEPQGVLLQ